MAVNLAQKYASQLDQIWTHASYTDNWINKKYDFDGVKKRHQRPRAVMHPINSFNCWKLPLGQSATKLSKLVIHEKENLTKWKSGNP